MQESDFSTCRGPCGMVKVRITAGKFPSGSKKYVDHLNRLWVGRKCPDCSNERIKNAMQKARVDKRASAVGLPAVGNKNPLAS